MKNNSAAICLYRDTICLAKYSSAIMISGVGGAQSFIHEICPISRKLSPLDVLC